MHRPQTGVTREALKGYFPKGNFASRLQPMPEQNCIYVKNAKAACGTTLLWLHRMHTGDHSYVPTIGIHAQNGLPRPADVGWRNVIDMLAGDAFRFTFVRDPIRRIESAYRDKILRHRTYSGRAELQRILGRAVDPAQEVTFEDFIAALMAQEPLMMDAHWRPQHLNVMHPLVEYDMVGRVEHYAADLERIREAAGLPHVPTEVQHATRKSESLLDGRSSLWRQVRDLYSRDFELYGY